jgi:hypothetical protein
MSVRALINKAWAVDAPLTVTAITMSIAFVFSAAGIFLDPRMILGFPAWLKPTKFAISTAIFSATMIWLWPYITVWPRFMRAIGWILSIVVFIEVGIIDVQAARGTTSHFNFSTPLDGALFGIMGAAIAVLLLAVAAVFVALCRTKFANPAWGWSLRLGMLMMVLGSAMGGLMTQPTHDQMAEIKREHKVTIAGAHTVGAPDGGPGIAGVGWSTEHGDLRIPHFFGLHGIQAIPLLSFLLVRNRKSVAGALAIAASYYAFVAILTWQALRGESIVAPNHTTLAALAIWFAGSLAAMFTIRRQA